MRTKYRIGFFALLFLLICLLGIGYQVSYQYVMDRHQTNAEQRKQEETESILTKGDAEKNDGYYIAELQGYIVVYLSDQSTIYEFTDIPIQELPDDLKAEVKKQKYVKTAKELYAFLENYSS